MRLLTQSRDILGYFSSTLTSGSIGRGHHDHVVFADWIPTDGSGGFERKKADVDLQKQV